MSRGRAAAWVPGWVVLTSCLAACFSERPRPAPPVLSIVLDKLGVRSPDTLTGRVRASDPDGLDSVWVTVDTIQVGEDGLLDPDFNRPFLFPIAAGHAVGSRVRVLLKARDVVGFQSELDSSVTVVR